MDYAEELVACQQHMISLRQKHYFLRGQMGCMDEPASWSIEVTKFSASTR
jgi:hypothetical protein